MLSMTVEALNASAQPPHPHHHPNSHPLATNNHPHHHHHHHHHHSPNPNHYDDSSQPYGTRHPLAIITNSTNPCHTASSSGSSGGGGGVGGGGGGGGFSSDFAFSSGSHGIPQNQLSAMSAGGTGVGGGGGGGGLEGGGVGVGVGGSDCMTEQLQQQQQETTPSSVAMTTTEVTLLSTILVTVFLSSCVANVFVCVVFSKRRCSLSLSNRFLANLTVCNCLFTLLVMPLAFASLVSRQWLFGEALCQCAGLVINLLVTASIFTLVVISLDRYCAVVTPLHYNMRMTRRRCWGFIAGIWTGSFAVSVPPLLGWSSFKFHVNKMICTVAWDSDTRGAKYYTLFLVTVSFLLPLVAMLWTYGCIFRAAKDNSERTRRSSIVPTVQAETSGGDQGGGVVPQSTPINKRRSSSVPIIRRLSQTSSRSNSILQRREEWKTAVTSFLILFSFMLCWLPYFLVICLRSLAPGLHLHPVMSTISTVAAMFGCACNPMVYVFRSKGTRHDLKVILTRRRGGSSSSYYRHEVVQTGGGSSNLRGGRGGSVRETRVMEGGGGGGGGVVREKGSVFWQEELCLPGAGECHSIREESGGHASDDGGLQSPGTNCGAQNGAPPSLTQLMRSSPSLQQF